MSERANAWREYCSSSIQSKIELSRERRRDSGESSIEERGKRRLWTRRYANRSRSLFSRVSRPIDLLISCARRKRPLYERLCMKKFLRPTRFYAIRPSTQTQSPSNYMDLSFFFVNKNYRSIYTFTVKFSLIINEIKLLLSVDYLGFTIKLLIYNVNI